MKTDTFIQYITALSSQPAVPLPRYILKLRLEQLRFTPGASHLSFYLPSSYLPAMSVWSRAPLGHADVSKRRSKHDDDNHRPLAFSSGPQAGVTQQGDNGVKRNGSSS